ncbi:hypothetical protein QYM36_018700, partial [Artemia franciscana]
MALIIGAFATVLEPSGDMGLAGTTGGGAGAEFRDGGTSCMALIIGAFATVLEPSGDMGLAGTTGGGAGAEFRDGGT